MKFKAPGRKNKKEKESKEHEEQMAAALTDPPEEPVEAPPAEESPAEEAPAEEAPAPVEEDPVPQEPLQQPAAEEEASPESAAEADPLPVEADPVSQVSHEPVSQVSHEETEEVSVELNPIKPVCSVLKRGPYHSASASAKTAKTLKKQKWSSQFCRIDPSLNQIFCCEKDRAKLYEEEQPIVTEGKCSFYHFSFYTTVQNEEDDPKGKEFYFKIIGLNGDPENSLQMSASCEEERDRWTKTIRRAVNRMHIDQDRLGDHTKLRTMLTSQEAEICILEEELEKMAVVASECSGRACLAEEKLALKTAEVSDLSTKLQLATLEIASQKSQLAIMEERTKNLSILADDVNGTCLAEYTAQVQKAKQQMQAQRAERLKAIQLEIGGDEDYLEKYKKYLNSKRDQVLQKHGSQYSLSSPMSLNSPTTPGTK